MYSVAYETDDATAVGHCAYGKFMFGEGKQLAAVSGRVIRFFRVNPYALVPPSTEHLEWLQKTKLECMFVARFLSRIKSLAVTRIPQHPDVDSLLLAFDDGKISIVAMIPDMQQLGTYSIHQYETEALRDGYTKNFPIPIVKADPSSRCAAMLVYGRHLAVLPLVEGQEFIHSFTIPLLTIDPRLENIVDMAFLDGYYEPTILFLYEPLQTTPGRACIRNDSMCTMAVSINIFDRRAAVVWQQTSLPLDLYSLYTIPKPLGGVLVLGANEIIYLNQATPPLGVAVNGCFDRGFTKFPLKDLKHLALSFDAAHATYIGNYRFVLASKDGSLFSLFISTDSSKAPKAIVLNKVASCSIPYCITMCAPGHIFLGSRVGDSQLLEYALVPIVKDENEILIDTTTDISMEDDDDDFLFYGSHSSNCEAVAVVEEFVVEIKELDRLVNIGPVRTITAGYAILSDSFVGSRPDLVVDFVAAVGHSKDGSLCVFQKSLRPIVATSTIIEGAERIWAVGRCEDDSHKFMIISRRRSTLVLEISDANMVELDKPLFITDEPTIISGELSDGAIAIQITPHCIALVAEGARIQLIQLDFIHSAVSASICDPFVALLLLSGDVILYKLEMSGRVAQLELVSTAEMMPNAEDCKITAITLYKDLSGLMIVDDVHLSKKEHRDAVCEDDIYGDMDETDRMLYGLTSSKVTVTKKQSDETVATRKKKRLGEVQAASGGEESDAPDPNTIIPTFWLLVARDDGCLSIYSLEIMEIAFQSLNIGAQACYLTDATSEEIKDARKVKEEHRQAREAAALHSNASFESALHGQKPEERVAELLLTGMGFNQGHPILFCVIDDCVIAYELFKCKSTIPGHLSAQFRRLHFTLCVRNQPFVGADGRKCDLQRSAAHCMSTPLFHVFERIGNIMNGVMLAGPIPTFLLYSPMHGLIKHQLILDGPISFFSSFNNSNNPMGFLYLTQDTEIMRIARLEPDISLESSIPVKKIALGNSPCFVRYLIKDQLYVLVESTPLKTARLCVVVNDEKTIETHEKPKSFILPEAKSYKLSLISPKKWEKLPRASFKLEELEEVTSCEEVLLRTDSAMSGLENYIAIGTVSNYGEEVLIRGRLILLRVVDVFDVEEEPFKTFNVVYDKEQKGPITSICSCNGYLYTGMGPKVFIWELRDNQFHGIAFLDLDFYIHVLVPIKDYVVACDMYKSIRILRYQDQFKALSIVSRDNRKDPQPLVSTDVLVDERRTMFVVSDTSGNLYFLTAYNDEGIADKMPVRAHFNVGSVITNFIRIACHISLMPGPLSQADIKRFRRTHNLLFTTIDGSLGYIHPINEKVFRRLNFITQMMVEDIPVHGGLHPIGARMARPIPELAQRLIVDLEFAQYYLHLSVEEKKDLARQVGTNRYAILDDLFAISKATTMY